VSGATRSIGSTRPDAVIAGILLASGASRRFGADKLVAPLDGRAVVRWSAEALVGVVDELVVVVRADAPALRAALDGLRLRIVVNHESARGMSTAIRAGIDTLSPEVEAAVVALGDQPLVERRVIERLVEQWRAGGARAVQPRYAEGRGHPVLFDASLFPALRALDADVGARVLLDSLGDALAVVSVAGSRPADVDTPASLRAVAAELARRGGA
jgi:molybdenum cofactor cytidylyltransferase